MSAVGLVTDLASTVTARAPTTVARAVGVLTQAPPPGTPGAGQGEEFGKTSPLALVVIIVLGLATALLIRSMNARLRNIPASFDDPPAKDGDGTGREASAEQAGDAEYRGGADHTPDSGYTDPDRATSERGDGSNK
jgi:hypothetical protein